MVTRRDTTSAKYSTPIICWIITSERAWSLAGVISPDAAPDLVQELRALGFEETAVIGQLLAG